MSTDTNNEQKRKKRETTEKGKNPPLHVIRHHEDRAIAVSIWLESAPDGFTYLDYTVSRSWKNKAGNTGYSSKFFARNKGALIDLVEQATAWMEEYEAKELAANPEAIAA
jgi:hypothetical protein